jgi:hypothetical protein
MTSFGARIESSNKNKVAALTLSQLNRQARRQIELVKAGTRACMRHRNVLVEASMQLFIRAGLLQCR